jgi:hypothetical protein
VLDGMDTHPETIWIDQLKQSDGVHAPAAVVAARDEPRSS